MRSLSVSVSECVCVSVCARARIAALTDAPQFLSIFTLIREKGQRTSSIITPQGTGFQHGHCA